MLIGLSKLARRGRTCGGIDKTAWNDDAGDDAAIIIRGEMQRRPSVVDSVEDRRDDD